MKAIMINNQWQQGEGPSLTSLNPITEAPVWQKHQASEAQVAEAVGAAHTAFKSWSRRSADERRGVVRKFAELLAEHKAELASVIHQETGKPQWEALTEVQAMINKVEISIDAALQRTGSSASLQHHAHGVMAVFGPYNFPGHLPNGHIVPALLAGNTIVFKPSELTPWVAERTVQLWQSAGLPNGVLNLVQGEVEVGKALCAQDIDGLLFTGSSTTGKLLHQQFGGRPEVILALEMGGNNPLIVDDSLSSNDIGKAADLIIRSAFISAGQRCTCARRLILVENNSTTALLNEMSQRCQQLNLDQSENSFYGPVISAKARDDLLSGQQLLIELGGKPLLHAKPHGQQGYVLTPGLVDVTDVVNGKNNIPDDEWFGPLLQVIRVADFEQALEIANRTRFGLAAGLVSNNNGQQQQFKQQIRAGVISINQPTAGASSKVPFGGIGASGNHRPSAWYAADYCAWPQAISAASSTNDYQPAPLPGLKSE